MNMSLEKQHVVGKCPKCPKMSMRHNNGSFGYKDMRLLHLSNLTCHMRVPPK